jgi:hypothetical protein
MVPPNKGCGWQTNAACVALGSPSFSKASSRPAGPSRKKDLIPLVTFLFTTEDSLQQIHRNGREGRKGTGTKESLIPSRAFRPLR